MAITRKSDSSLVDSDLISEVKIQPLSDKNEQTLDKKSSQKVKKPSFISTTIEELKLVEWPNLDYIWRWASVIIVFTFILAVFMGGIDNIFSGGIKFVDCSSPQSGKRTTQECSQEFVKNLAGQK